MAAAQAGLRLAQIRYTRSEELVALDKTVIRAPFAGVAGLRQVSPGAYVGKGDDIVRLDALGILKLEVPVPETRLSLVRIGLPVTLTVDALPG